MIKNLETMVLLYEELDNCRGDFLLELIRHYGAARCPVLRSKEGLTLAQSDEFLESVFLNLVFTLERMAFHCRRQVKGLRKIQDYVLRGRSASGCFGPDRSEWAEDFLALVTLVERKNCELRSAMAERRQRLARGPVSKLRKKEAVVRPGFAVAKNVEKATLQ